MKCAGLWRRMPKGSASGLLQWQMPPNYQDPIPSHSPSPKCQLCPLLPSPMSPLHLWKVPRSPSFYILSSVHGLWPPKVSIIPLTERPLSIQHRVSKTTFGFALQAFPFQFIYSSQFHLWIFWFNEAQMKTWLSL